MSRRFVLLSCFLLLNEKTQAAPGDLIEAHIETNGWVLALTFEGMPTNGKFDFGFNTNRFVASSNSLVLHLKSAGYGDDTTATPLDRVLRGSKQLRYPFPREDNHVVNVQGNAMARIALSDFVYSNCTDITVTAAQGFYTAGIASAYTNIPVLNHSQQPHQPAIAKWSWPPFWRITNATYRVRAVAFHGSGRDLRPVRAVKFWGIGSDGRTNEPVIVTMPVVDSAMKDHVPVVEYVADLDATPFRSSSTNELVWVTNHFAVYPWMGDTNSVIRTDQTTNSAPSPYPAPYPLLVETTNGATFLSVAVVALEGNSAGSVVSSSAFDPEAPPSPFATINQAVAAIRVANGLRFGQERSNAGNAVIYLKEGVHHWSGGTAAVGYRPQTWTTIEAFPTANWTNCVLGNRAGSFGYASRFDRISKLKITPTVGNATFREQHMLWLDECILDSTDNALNRPTNVWVTSSTLVTNGTQGLAFLPGSPTTFHLIRGNRFAPFSSTTIQNHLVIGNLRDFPHMANNSGLSFVESFNQICQPTLMPVFAYNKLLYLSHKAGSAAIDWFKGNGLAMGSTNDCVGAAVVQNLIEVAHSTPVGSPALAIAWGNQSSPTANRVNNVIIWNNTFIGARCNLGEDTAGDGMHDGIPSERKFWSVQNNIFASANTKHDNTYTANGGRVHGWPILYGVGWSGNLDQRINVDCGWYFENLGLNSHQFRDCDDSRTNYPGYVDYRGYVPSADGTGGGDYSITTSSLAHNYGMMQSLPFDLAGKPRVPNAWDVGAYAAVVPRLFRLTPQLGEGPFLININTEGDGLASVETSTNLFNWDVVDTITITNGSGAWQDPTTEADQKFYRVRF